MNQRMLQGLSLVVVGAATLWAPENGQAARMARAESQGGPHWCYSTVNSQTLETWHILSLGGDFCVSLDHTSWEMGLCTGAHQAQPHYYCEA